MNHQTSNSTEWFQANGIYSGGRTTIRRKDSRKIPYNQMEGDLAHCTIFDLNDNVLVLNEAVTNGGTYQLIRIDDIVFLGEQGISSFVITAG